MDKPIQPAATQASPEAVGLTVGRPNLEVFAETLLEVAQRDRDVLAITSDSRGSGKLTHFGQVVPRQIVEAGIAEQNLVGVAAGLASAGKKVFAVSPACFLTARSLEQIKNDVAYSGQPVKLIGISAGVSYGALGSTHHSLHDLAVLRAIHNIDIVAPADNFETREAIRAAVNRPRATYIRFGKKPMPHLHGAGAVFQIGKAITLLEGKDLTFVATGETVPHALSAARLLSTKRISACVLSVHTIKPLDEEALLEAGRKTGAVVTVEEHSICGGLGEACASLLMEAGIKVPFRRVAFPDEDTVTGSQGEVFSHYGISGEGLARTARNLLHP